MRYPIRSMLLCLLVFAVLALGCRGCPPQPPPPNTNGNASPGPTAKSSTSTKSDSRVSRVDANVMAGDSAPLSPLTDNEPHDLTPGTRVNTDPQGEARLELSGCDVVYLFRSSTMAYAPCSKSDSRSGGISCLEGGTAVYNSECAGRVEQVMQTPTQNITPRGTWFSVTYLPDRQLTITIVLKGSVEVRPVINIENRTLGEPMIIKEGQYSMTMPDSQADQQDYDVAKFREPKATRDSLSELNKYLKPWLDRIRKHADEDKIPRQSYAFTADVDCDCERLEFGSRLPCIRGEAEVWKRYYETGELGKCDPQAQGPNARPRGEVVIQ